jgi:Protein of unknown function (DUF1761)
MSFATQFVSSCLEQFTTASGVGIYVGCVAFVQVTGATWYSLLFGRRYATLVFPAKVKDNKVTSNDDWKRYFEGKYFTPEEKARQPMKYQTSMVVSSISILLLRGLIGTTLLNDKNNQKVAASQLAMDGALLGVIVTTLTSLFDTVHVVFADRSVEVHFIDAGYTIVSHAVCGAVLAMSCA